jgi:hypothetical protein
MLNGLFEDTKEDIQKSVEEEVIDVSAEEGDEKAIYRSLLISRNTLYMTPEDAEEFYRRLRGLVREYVRDEDQSVPTNLDEQSYGLMIALYPCIRLTSDVTQPKP